MTAATIDTSPRTWVGDRPVLPLAAGALALAGCIACIDTAAHVVVPAVAGNANLIPIGRFEGTVDNTASAFTTQIVVQLRNEIELEYLANDTAAPITMLLAPCYLLDNQTVTASATGNALAGRVLDIDPSKGIGVLFPAF